MNWYKKAQINDSKVKYGPIGEFYILSRNTKQNEGPWRVSAITSKGIPHGHEHFPTYEEALERYDNLEGIEKNVYELV